MSEVTAKRQKWTKSLRSIGVVRLDEEGKLTTDQQRSERGAATGGRLGDWRESKRIG